MFIQGAIPSGYRALFAEFCDLGAFDKADDDAILNLSRPERWADHPNSISI
jgi:hypothetical protein